MYAERKIWWKRKAGCSIYRANYVVQCTYYVVICSVVLRAKEGGERLVGDAEKGREKKRVEERLVAVCRTNYVVHTMLYAMCYTESKICCTYYVLCHVLY